MHPVGKDLDWARAFAHTVDVLTGGGPGSVEAAVTASDLADLPGRLMTALRLFRERGYGFRGHDLVQSGSGVVLVARFTRVG